MPHPCCGTYVGLRIDDRRAVQRFTNTATLLSVQAVSLLFLREGWLVRRADQYVHAGLGVASRWLQS